MAVVSRLEINHPALGTPGGTALYNSVEGMYEKIGDNMADRFFMVEGLASGASTDVDHNFNTDFSNLRYDLYLLTNATTKEIGARITKSSTPAITAFTIVAKTGNEKTHITITNSSGVSRDLVLVVFDDPIELDELVDVDFSTPPEDGQAMVFEQSSSSWKPGASGDSSFKFQKLTGTVLTIKKGYLVLSSGEEIYSAADLSPDLATAIPGADGNYYGYFDRTTFPAASTVSGRKLIAMTSSQLVFSTTTPDQINLSRYVPIGKVIKSTGVFSGLETLAMRRHGLEAGLRIKAYTGTALNGLTALPGVHYIVDMSGVSADKGFVMPAGSDLARTRVSIIPPSSLYKFSVTANGAETFIYGGVSRTSIDFPAGAETGADFCWNGTAWVVEDATTPISGTFSGDFLITGSLSANDTRNYLINGAMEFAQRGATIDAASTFVNNDDSYALDRWYILSDGNDVIDVTQNAEAPSGSSYSIGLDVETANKKFGIAQIIESFDAKRLQGKAVTLNFKAKVSSLTKLDNVKAAIISWTGTADAVTSDIISAWGAEGVNPTLIANANYENTPVNLGVGTNWASFSLTGVIDTPSTNNLIVMIWSDVTDTTVADFLYVTDISLNEGPNPCPFQRAGGSFQSEFDLCCRFFEKGHSSGIGGDSVGGYARSGFISFKVKKRIVPTSGGVVSGTWFTTGGGSNTTVFITEYRQDGISCGGPSNGGWTFCSIAWTQDTEL